MKSSSIVTASVIASSTLAAVASADVTFTLNQSTFLCGQFFAATDYSTATGFTGTLTGADINVTLNDSFGPGQRTWAYDLTVRVTSTPTYSPDSLIVNVGSASGGGSAGTRWTWNGGGYSGTPGTVCRGPSMVTEGAESIDLTGNPGYTLWIGNGWTNGFNPLSGATWTGTITLRGVNAVPAPGVLALLGVGGLLRSRRRRA
jgi:MYXO-CTERM domain-containing protein